MTVRSLDAYLAFGDPTPEKHLIVWQVPEELRRGAIPRKIYCHKLLQPRLSHAFCNLITTGYIDELLTWDGCFLIRPVRGKEKEYKALLAAGRLAEAMALLSFHSWGLAVDVNAATNKLGAEPTLSPGFVRCFTDAGFEWGGRWRRKDGMHFQIAAIT